MISDPLSDLLTRIRNAQKTRSPFLLTPASRLREAVLAVLEREGYIVGFERFDDRPGISRLKVFLKYYEGQPVVQEVKRVSKPGRRVYERIKDLGRFRNGLGIYVLSTSHGVLSDGEARKLNVSGEILCQVY